MNNECDTGTGVVLLCIVVAVLAFTVSWLAS